MIRRAQIKFMFIIMTIVFVVFSIIFSVYFFIVKDTTENAIDRTINDIFTEITRPNAPPEHIPEDCVVAIFSKEQTLVTTKIRFDPNAFTSEQADYVIKTIVASDQTSGTIDTIYYKTFSEETTNVLIALDRSDALALFTTNMLNSAFILLFFFLVLFFIAWWLSFFVFRPIKESFYKQREFISNASHELKTPLAIISANADVVQTSSHNPYLESIQEQTKRMSTLVTDLLTLAKMDEKSVSLYQTEFNLSDQVLNSTLPFDAIAFEKGKSIEVDIEPNITIYGDATSVKNLINILLDNAVKHASKNGQIIVKLKKENGKIILTVFNMGSMVPDQDSFKVFERFYRPDNSRSRDSGGSGLGLAIAKGIVDSNKWKIYAQSKFNHSMTITVIF